MNAIDEKLASIPRKNMNSQTDPDGVEARKKETTRINLIMHHPIVTQERVLPTPPIQELCKTVKRAVLLRQMGVYFTAPSGAGKTNAIAALIRFLKKEFPGLAVLQHNSLNKQVPSIRAFFKHFLQSVGYPDLSGETYELRRRTVLRIVDDGRLSTYNMVVFIVDEAQAMEMDDFCFLKDVSNEVLFHNVQLVTILMAQSPDFNTVVAELNSKKRLDLISRFAMRHLPFRAFNCIEDIQAVLRGIDSEIYPKDKGWTWTEFFFPKAFAAGFRLENESANLLAAIREMGKHLYGNNFVFPARQLFEAIRSFMIDNAGYDSPNMALPAESWKINLEEAGMPEALKLANLVPAREAEIKVTK
jgi:hypothetical protein